MRKRAAAEETETVRVFTFFRFLEPVFLISELQPSHIDSLLWIFRRFAGIMTGMPRSVLRPDSVLGAGVFREAFKLRS